MSAADVTSRPEGLPARSRRRKLLLLAASVALSLLLAEGGLRLLGYGANRGPYRQVYAGKGIVLMCFDTNPGGYFDVNLADRAVRERFYRDYGVIDMEKDYRYTPYGVVTSEDELHMRPNQRRPRTPGKIRLVAIGDSFTYGHGLKDGDPWPSQLESLLNENVAPGKDRFEVLNCGIGARDLPQINKCFFEHVLGLKPDAVLYGWCLNDVVVSPRYVETRVLPGGGPDDVRTIPNRYQGDGWVEVTGARRWFAIYDLFQDKRMLFSKSMDMAGYINDPYGQKNAEGWAESKRLLYEMAGACRSRQALLHVAIWPMLADVSEGYQFAPAHEAIAEACRTENIPVVDLRERLRAYPTKDLILHGEDPHPNKLACRLAAEAIRDHLRQNHFLWFH